MEYPEGLLMQSLLDSRIMFTGTADRSFRRIAAASSGQAYRKLRVLQQSYAGAQATVPYLSAGEIEVFYRTTRGAGKSPGRQPMIYIYAAAVRVSPTYRIMYSGFRGEQTFFPPPRPSDVRPAHITPRNGSFALICRAYRHKL